jgi:hypothetical protein
LRRVFGLRFLNRRGRELPPTGEPAEPQEVAPPEPAPEPRHVQLVTPEPELEPEPEPETPPEPAIAVIPPAVPREWNLWELERVTRESAGADAARDEERSFLLMYLREFADPDGVLPVTFDPLVRETFGELLGASRL